LTYSTAPAIAGAVLRPHGFEQDGILLAQLQFVQLALGDKAVILADHDDGRQAVCDDAKPVDGILQQ
jgi:hypothetical protein